MAMRQQDQLDLPDRGDGSEMALVRRAGINDDIAIRLGRRGAAQQPGIGAFERHRAGIGCQQH